MPEYDISKCRGKWCKKKSTCWRYLAPGHQYQSYILPEKNQVADCPEYWEHKPKKPVSVKYLKGLK